jgi:hypothetical protein
MMHHHRGRAGIPRRARAPNRRRADSIGREVMQMDGDAAGFMLGAVGRHVGQCDRWRPAEVVAEDMELLNAFGGEQGQVY